MALRLNWLCSAGSVHEKLKTYNNKDITLGQWCAGQLLARGIELWHIAALSLEGVAVAFLLISKKVVSLSWPVAIESYRDGPVACPAQFPFSGIMVLFVGARRYVGTTCTCPLETYCPHFGAPRLKFSLRYWPIYRFPRGQPFQRNASD